ncbi:MAG: hypothetical protein ACJ8H8_27675 [Geminicoccaceae bacterium]
MDRTNVDAVVEALAIAGFDRHSIKIVIVDDVPDIDTQPGATGVRGFLTRLNLNIGDDLDYVEEARNALKSGCALVLVAVRDDAERDRAHAILRRHGGHAMSYFGRWTVAKLEAGGVH